MPGGSSMYTGATGMENQQLNLDIIANNLANINTPGFKKSEAEFSDLLYQTLKTMGADSGAGAAGPSGIEIGYGSQLVATNKVFTQGSLKATEDQFAMAIEGDGFFEVQLTDGTSAYTRAGNFKVDSTGQMVTSGGLVVQSSFGAIPAGSTLAVMSNGQATVALPGGGTQTFRIQLTRFANPSGLKSLGGSLLKETPASGTPEVGNPSESGFGQIMQRHLESSNVNAVDEMVKMIIAQRAYEMNSKAIQAADDGLQLTAHLKR